MPNTQAEMMTVEVAYALPQTQTIIALTVSPGTTALEAVIQSGIAQQYPDISLDHLVLGIFGKKTEHGTILKAMDRVEIYRPLLANPKEARRLRAAAKNGK
ncbi:MULTISPECIES: RnfH family protein [unclassified Methylophilus]|uniref:RnfH family protein n=1 Tax=unclassified Methylophilus TaxID=2630143 RepID=UPI00037E2303|nr:MULTISPECIES: RnfH family protein [unclassified Methylophilus]